jgi:hypothetical protein
LEEQTKILEEALMQEKTKSLRKRKAKCDILLIPKMMRKKKSAMMRKKMKTKS